jgi:hypothetical protein
MTKIDASPFVYRRSGDDAYAVDLRKSGELIGWVRRTRRHTNPGGSYRGGRWVYSLTRIEWVGYFTTRHEAADYMRDVWSPKAAWLTSEGVR